MASTAAGVDELSLTEAQRLTGISLYLLRAAIANGRLEARNAGGGVARWRISCQSLDSFAAAYAPDGLSIAQAQREYGISRQALRAAVEDGRLLATNARQHHDRPGGEGDRWRFPRAELERFIASCPRCPWPDCDRPGVTAAGRCSREHSGTLPGTTRSPETRAKISAAKMGQTKGVPRPHTPVWDQHVGEGIRAFWADAERSAPYRRAKSEELRRSWEKGNGAAPGVLAAKGGPLARSRWGGRWGARDAGRVGGRKRGYTALQAKGVLELKRTNPKLGIRRLAVESDLSPWQVREILADHEDDPR